MKAALAGTPVSDFSTDVCRQVGDRGRLQRIAPAAHRPLPHRRQAALPRRTKCPPTPAASTCPRRSSCRTWSACRSPRPRRPWPTRTSNVQDRHRRHLARKPAGMVTKQDHSAGKPMLQGTEVVLHVSAGEAVSVPALTDLTLDEAQALLASAGLVGRGHRAGLRHRAPGHRDLSGPGRRHGRRARGRPCASSSAPGPDDSAIDASPRCLGPPAR